MPHLRSRQPGTPDAGAFAAYFGFPSLPERECASDSTARAAPPPLHRCDPGFVRCVPALSSEPLER
jgi:hypothetical protein